MCHHVHFYKQHTNAFNCYHVYCMETAYTRLQLLPCALYANSLHTPSIVTMCTVCKQLTHAFNCCHVHCVQTAYTRLQLLPCALYATAYTRLQLLPCALYAGSIQLICNSGTIRNFETYFFKSLQLLFKPFASMLYI